MKCQDKKKQHKFENGQKLNFIGSAYNVKKRVAAGPGAASPETKTYKKINCICINWQGKATAFEASQLGN